MIYHVLPGDSLAATFRESGIAGEVIIFRDALISGPIDFDNPDEFWEARARFVLNEYAEDEIQFHETVADEIERLVSVEDGDEVNLWFEYELFCSVNMWFCLSRLKGFGVPVYRVEPAMLSEKDRWTGFGKAGSDDLRECFGLRQKFTDADLEVGSALWDAYRKHDASRLREIAKEATERFPYLEEVCDAAAEIEVRPREILDDVVGSTGNEFGAIFAEFSKRAGVYGFGDLQVEALVSSIQSS